MSSRRKFIKTAALTGVGVTIGMPAIGKNVLGANRRINVAVFGTNSRGNELTKTFAKAKDSFVLGIGDVDTRAVAKTQKAVYEITGERPSGNQDFRRFLDDKDVDAVVIATPDHWHAPMAIMALEAGKHVYVEKPCSHNPQEGEWLVAKQKQTGKLVQMGNQTRSSVTLNKIVKEIQEESVIGKAYAGNAWYANTRESIGRREQTFRPEWLDWELWQGPAPHRKYESNIVHYKWHWYWDYGTGELLNNGTHEIDMCRWALGVRYPNKITSTGGRFHYDDDWEAFDTQDVGFEFEENKMISWHGRSCNGMPTLNRGRGSMIYGTEGSVLMTRGGYTVYDLKGKEIRNEKEAGKNVSIGTSGGGSLTDGHAANFISAINSGVQLNSPIEDANPSVTMCHLGNIAQRTTGVLHLDTKNGRPIDNPEAMKLWAREYEKGWKPKV
jgi:predicted dehydrogenase